MDEDKIDEEKLMIDVSVCCLSVVVCIKLFGFKQTKSMNNNKSVS
jgi:hypothetical protein